MATQRLDPKLLEILACPACDDRPPLTLSGDGSTLDCAECGRSYPIEDGIPVLLVDRGVIADSVQIANPNGDAATQAAEVTH